MLPTCDFPRPAWKGELSWGWVILHFTSGIFLRKSERNLWSPFFLSHVLKGFFEYEIYILLSILLLNLFKTFHHVKAPKLPFFILFWPEDHSTYACYCKKLAKMNLVFNKVLLGGCFYSLELTRFCVCCHVADLWLSTPCLKTRAFLFETHNILSSSQRRAIYMFQFFFFFLPT